MPYKTTEDKKAYHKEYHTQWYKANKDKVRKVAKRTKLRQRKWFHNIKKKSSCIKCGASHPAIIDFHHRDPATKEFAIGNGYQRYSKRKVLAEIEKCDTLCRNCHAILHWGDNYDD